MSPPCPGSAKHERPYVFDRIVDFLLKLRRDDRLAWLAEVDRGLDRFPALATRDRRALLRGIVLHELFDRLIFRFQMRLPSVASFASRFVRVYGATRIFRETPRDRSIIISLTHFGAVHFVFAALMPMLRGRRVYVMHAGGETGDPVARYMRRLGAIPLVNDDRALRKLSALMAEDPGCAIVYAFDYMAYRGRRPIPFLGAMVSVGRSVAFLADTRDAVVAAVFPEYGPGRLRVRVAGPFAVDRSLDREARQDSLTRQLFALVETRVLQTPCEWTEWTNCASVPEVASAGVGRPAKVPIM